MIASDKKGRIFTGTTLIEFLCAAMWLTMGLC